MRREKRKTDSKQRIIQQLSNNRHLQQQTKGICEPTQLGAENGPTKSAYIHINKQKYTHSKTNTLFPVVTTLFSVYYFSEDALEGYVKHYSFEALITPYNILIRRCDMCS